MTNKRCGDVVSLGVGVFALVCAAVQGLRTDLDWLRAPLSFYLIGPYALWVRGAYFALAVALVALGIGYYRGLSLKARSAAPLLLFVCSAIALVVTSLAETDTPSSLPTFAGYVHGVAAQATFLCLTTAMLLQSWRLRGDPLWRPHFMSAAALAVFCFVALWVHTLRWDAFIPRGLGQKLLILAILSWLGMAAHWLRHQVMPEFAVRRNGSAA